MRNNQLLYLSLSCFIILFIGMGLFPVLPSYDAQFGATRTVVGLHFALMYAANVAGHMLAGRLAARLTRQGAFVMAGMLGIPALVLLGHATALWHVLALTAIVWFCGGMDFALVGVFTGLHADRDSRGRSFVVTYLAYPLGATFGGATVGRLVAWQGYPVMFAVLGAVWAFLPLVGLLKLKDKETPRPAASTAQARGASTQSSRTPALARQARAFHWLLAVMLMSATAIGVGRLGMPLSMQALDFPAGAIASVTAMSGLVAVPVAFLIGALSDRLGRRRFLALIYALVAGGMLILSAADQVWHFWLAATLMFVALSTNGALTSALATDILPQEALSRSLPRITALNSAAAVLSFASTGFVMDTFGATTLYVAAAGLALVATLQLRRVKSHAQRVEARVANLSQYEKPTVQSAVRLNTQLPDTHQLRRMESSC